MRDLVKDGVDDNQGSDSRFAQQARGGRPRGARELFSWRARQICFWKRATRISWNPLARKSRTNIGTKKCISLAVAACFTTARRRMVRKIKSTSRACIRLTGAIFNCRTRRPTTKCATPVRRFVELVDVSRDGRREVHGRGGTRALQQRAFRRRALDGTLYYTNPLRVTDPMPVELRWSRPARAVRGSFRWVPPNLVRTIAESANYAYAKSGDSVFVNLYGASDLETTLANGEKIKLSQETDYPWNGRVRIKIEACGKKQFSLKLRIPGRADGASVRVNGSPSDFSPLAESYFEIKRAWKAGDFVDLDLPMPVRLMEANPLVEDDLNQVAVQRGPVVYCLESPDLPRGVKISDVLIPSDMKLTARYDRRLLDGIVVLEGRALARPEENWSGELYREFQRSELKPFNVKFIPYSVWQNRGPSEMSVWLTLAGH